MVAPPNGSHRVPARTRSRAGAGTAARRMGGGSCSPSMASRSHSAICSGAFLPAFGAFGLVPPSGQCLYASTGSWRRSTAAARGRPSALWQVHQDRAASRSSRSGSSRILTLSPALAWAPACIFLFTSRICFCRRPRETVRSGMQSRRFRRTLDGPAAPARPAPDRMAAGQSPSEGRRRWVREARERFWASTPSYIPVRLWDSVIRVVCPSFLP